MSGGRRTYLGRRADERGHPLTEEQVSKKARACASYVSEIPAEIHPINSVRQIAAAVGLVRLLPYAEQYALVRQVRR